MSVRDLVADILDDLSTESRPQSPSRRPPESVARVSKSPRSPRSQGIPEKTPSGGPVHRAWRVLVAMPAWHDGSPKLVTMIFPAPVDEDRARADAQQQFGIERVLEVTK